MDEVIPPAPAADPTLGDEPALPDYAGPCLTNVVPALLEQPAVGSGWLDPAVGGAAQVVLLVIDGLGWHQLCERRNLTPTLHSMTGERLRTVAPSTTAAALTSLTTGAPPGEHGVVGYRLDIDRRPLNVLRWTTPAGDARDALPPSDLQPLRPFFGRRPPVVSRAEFTGSGFTLAHLRETRLVGYKVISSLVTEVRRLLAEGERFVYAYYDGVDKVSHEYGLGQHFDDEVAFADRLVADVAAVLPAGAALVVTADHGQVHVGDRLEPLHADVMACTDRHSGEARFMWLHARPGRSDELVEAARARHGHQAWVVRRETAIAQGWFGPVVTPEAAHRLGDVAVVAREPVAFHDPAEPPPVWMIGRHGGLTAAEMDIPLLSVVA